MTATERAKQLNQESDGCCLTTDASHWDGYGIHTAKELDKYLAQCCYWSLYKDKFGVKPRHIDFTSLSEEQIMKLIEDL